MVGLEMTGGGEKEICIKQPWEQNYKSCYIFSPHWFRSCFHQGGRFQLSLEWYVTKHRHICGTWLFRVELHTPQWADSSVDLPPLCDIYYNQEHQVKMWFARSRWNRSPTFCLYWPAKRRVITMTSCFRCEATKVPFRVNILADISLCPLSLFFFNAEFLKISNSCSHWCEIFSVALVGKWVCEGWEMSIHFRKWKTSTTYW